MDEFTCENTIKILSSSDTPEPGNKTSRPSIETSTPMDEIKPVLLDNPAINELFPQKAHDEITDQADIPSRFVLRWIFGVTGMRKVSKKN